MRNTILKQKMMEAESTFLSKDESKENVFKVLNKVLNDLNASKMTTIVEGETTIHLKIISHFNDPPMIYDHLVPLLNDKFKDIPREAWDLTTHQVMEFDSIPMNWSCAFQIVLIFRSIRFTGAAFYQRCKSYFTNCR